MKWLFLVHQVQTRNSRERVKAWRLLKKVGAILHRNSVYVLPYDKERLEDMQWICQQIRDSRGEASVYISEARDASEDRLLRRLFVQSRSEEYAALEKAGRNLLARIRKSRNKHTLPELEKEALQLREWLEEIKRIDFFSPAPPSEILRLFQELTRELTAVRSGETVATRVLLRRREDYRRKVWATREKIHVDRLGSAWLICRFIDPHAKFLFAPEKAMPAGAILFDTLGAEFTHQSEDCTFETILKSFRIRNKGLQSIAEIIHDIDLKDRKYSRPEAAGIDAVIRALAETTGSDQELLHEGSKLFDRLLQHYSKNSVPQKRRKR